MGGTAPDIRIFISYRRDDAGPFCGSIYRHLKAHFGAEDRVFRDVDSIEPGRPWDYAIDDAVGSCDVFLVLIGPGWLTATDDEGKRRLDDEDDRHRREIEVALERKIRVFPVLLEDTRMPPRQAMPETIRGLHRIQAWRVRDDETFDWCVQQLTRLIEKAAERDADRRRATEADEQEAAKREQRVRELVSRAREQAQAGDTGYALATLDSARAEARELEDDERRGRADALVETADAEVRARPEAAERREFTAAYQHTGSSGTTSPDDTGAADEPDEPERDESVDELASAGLQASPVDQESGSHQPSAPAAGADAEDPWNAPAPGVPIRPGPSAPQRGAAAPAPETPERAGVITTVAGSGTSGFGGDGGRATAAQLSFAVGVGAAPDGSLLIADSFNQRVRRVAPDSTITTVAGTGKGFSGDGGSATAAQLYCPRDVAATPDGGFLIADSGNHRVRRVTPDGTITTVAGSGMEGFSGEGGPATEAQLSHPFGVAATQDGGLLIADTYNHRVRRVAPDGTITTVAGSGSEGFSGDGGGASAAQLWCPTGVAATADGGLLIADSGNHRVRHVTPNGTITTVAGSGSEGFSGDGVLAFEAELSNPEGVAATPDGGFLIADTHNHRVRRVAPDGTITTVAGSGTEGFSGEGGPAAEAALSYPHGLALTSGGDVLIADSQRVRRVSGVLPPDPVQDAAAAPGSPGRAAVITTVAGTGEPGFSGDGGPATAAQLYFPRDVAAAPDGGLLIADEYNHRVRRVAPDGTITTVAGTGAAGFGADGGLATKAQLSHPFGVAATQDGGLLIADTYNHRVRCVAPDGIVTTVAGTGTAGYGGDGGPATEAQLSAPFGIAAAPDGGFVIADQGNQRVRRVAPDGTITTVAGTGTGGFSGDGGPATEAQLAGPVHLAATADGGLLIADATSHRVRRVAPDGTITTVAGTGTAGYGGDGGPATEAQLSAPFGIAAARDVGFVIADTNSDRVRRVAPDGTITTVAGNGDQGFTGDGGPAIEAELTLPNGVAVTPDGDLLIADGHRVRRVSCLLPSGSTRRAAPAAGVPARDGDITIVAGSGEGGFAGDGGPATKAGLNYPTAVAVAPDGGS